MRTPLSCLLVGAGAVGQVIAHHAQRAGCRVGFLVKPYHLADLRDGATLIQHTFTLPPKTTQLQPFDLFDDHREIDPTEWDTLILCVSAPALRGPWLPSLLAHMPASTIVSLQPGLNDRDYLLQWLPPERLVRGMIPFLAYQSPLPGEKLPEAIAYFLPPLISFPFDGDRGPDIASTLSAGGLRSRAVDDVALLSGMASASLMPAVAGLELDGWDLRAFRKGPRLPLSARAARQAQAITAHHHGARVPLSSRLLRQNWLLRAGLSTAAAALPFDLEAYLAFHFQKTSHQTRQMLREWIDPADAHSLPADHLRDLLSALESR